MCGCVHVHVGVCMCVHVQVCVCVCVCVLSFPGSSSGFQFSLATRLCVGGTMLTINETKNEILITCLPLTFGKSH